MREGRTRITSRDYPSFLYDGEMEYKADAIDYGLLRGALLLAVCVYRWQHHTKSLSHYSKVFRIIFTGPSSALCTEAGPATKGRPPIAVMNKVKRVIPEMIAYAAVMVPSHP